MGVEVVAGRWPGMTTVKWKALRPEERAVVAGCEKDQRSISVVSSAVRSFPVLKPKHRKLVGDVGLCVLNLDVWTRARVIEEMVLSGADENSISPGT